MKSFAWLLLLCLFFSLYLPAQETMDYYWVGFKDKAGTSYSVARPDEFLSRRAIFRREKQHIPVDQSDLPVSPVYLDGLRNVGATIVHCSKWLNGATIKADPAVANAVSGLNYIREIQLSRPGMIAKSAHDKFAREKVTASIDTSYYGYSVHQIGQLNGQFLHNNGFQGQGIWIALLDAGYYRADQYAVFGSLWADGRLLRTRDFVSPGSNVFAEHYHGMSVLSVMAGNLPGVLIGSAPKASYLLFRTEDVGSEYLIEEDHWVAAAEYADSLGVDVINSSLGYTRFDDAAMDHTYPDMDGRTTRVTRGANMAARKGMLVVTSAGNEGNSFWNFIGAPADGDLVIGVGAVNSQGLKAPFSSFGPASDGDVKPNVAAMGQGTTIQLSNGYIGYGNGTSFSAPVLAGMAACLWQANPEARAADVKLAIEQSASQYHSPDERLGYGIPDFQLADELLKKQNSSGRDEWTAAPNPLQTHVWLYRRDGAPDDEITVRLFRPNGSLVYEAQFPPANPIYIPNLTNLPAGLYVADICCNNQSARLKLIKSGH
ncbi:S8 family serine peptidase [Gaoshiqia sp. Z1-71]|uniref:S8 family serine peptidase n=1 Tax=Gaoshiqia hydrogeniformans TaxID=3290090 RepID=UPI003BF82FFA